jgi:CHASE2 domain-containing sensor protein
VFTVIVSAFLSTMPDAGYFLQLFSLALCSLFLCSLLLMFTMRRWRGGRYWGTAIWTGIGLLPVAMLGQVWENLLMQMPPILTFGIAAAAFLLFLREVKITTQNNKEVYRYANR